MKAMNGQEGGERAAAAILLSLARAICYGTAMMRCGFLFLLFLPAVLFAETFELLDGKTLIGEAIGFNDNGLVVKLSSGNYQTERVSWGRLSQTTLKALSQNPKASKFVEPFIELSPEERAQRTALDL